MKKYILSLLLTALSLPLFAAPQTVTVNVGSGQYSNILAASATVIQVTITATTATNTSVKLIDSPINALTYTNAAYTSTLSYATNVVSTYTNFFGTTTSITNFALVDATYSIAAAVLNCPVVLQYGAIASTSAQATGVKYNFLQGIWATNTSSGSAAITIVYEK